MKYDIKNCFVVYELGEECKTTNGIKFIIEERKTHNDCENCFMLRHDCYEIACLDVDREDKKNIKLVEVKK